MWDWRTLTYLQIGTLFIGLTLISYTGLGIAKTYALDSSGKKMAIWNTIADVCAVVTLVSFLGTLAAAINWLVLITKILEAGAL